MTRSLARSPVQTGSGLRLLSRGHSDRALALAAMALAAALVVSSAMALASDDVHEDRLVEEQIPEETLAEEIPGEELRGEAAPLSLFQSQKDEPRSGEGTEVLASPPGREDGSVTSSDLETVGVEIFGLLSPEDGGLGYDLWRGSSLNVVAPALTALPEPGQSPARQKLFARLLLSRAYDPGGASGDIPFITLRARKLYEAGQLRNAEMILDQTAEPPADLASLQLMSEIYLLTQRTRPACAMAARTRSVTDDPFWSRLRTLCYSVADDRAAAQLGADLLAEQGYDDPLFFFAIANRVDNAGLSYSGLEPTDAIHFSLLADAGPGSIDSFPEDVLAARSSALRAASLMLAGVRGRGAEDLARIELPLAEKGVMNGSLPPEQLAILYGSVLLGEDEAAALIASDVDARTLEQGPSVRKAAAIYQAVSSAVMPGDQAELLKIAWDDAQRFDRRSLFVALYGDNLISLPIEPALDVYAPAFARAALAAGAYPEAAKWLQLAWQAGPRSDPEVDTLPGQTPPDQNAVVQNPVIQSPVVQNRETLMGMSVALQIVAPETAEFEPLWDVALRLGEASSAADPAIMHRAVLEVRIFEAFGGRLDELTRQLLVGYIPGARSNMPQTGVLSGLDAAARAGRKGEVVLLTLAALGDSKSAQVPIIVTAKCISALLRAGFMEEAKTLAIESLLADL